MHSENLSDEAVETTLFVSIREGIGAAIMSGAGIQQLTPLAIFLGGTATQIAILESLPVALGAFMQLAGIKLAETLQSRMSIMTILVYVQAAVWIPIAFTPLLLPHQWGTVTMLILLAAGTHGIGQVIAPIWLSLLGDLVPKARRGKFFGRRNKVYGYCLLAIMIYAGAILEIGTHTQAVSLSFAILFLSAAIFRLTSAFWLSRYQDPPMVVNNASQLGIKRFLKKLLKSNFGRYTVYLTLFNFSLYVAFPFFSLYLLKELKVPYLMFAALTGISMGSQFICMEWWGKLGDSFGNKKLLTISSIGIAILPAFWVISELWAYLVLLHIFTGATYAGFQISVNNFLLDSLPTKRRPRFIAYQGMCSAMGVLAGSLVGSQFLEYVTHSEYLISSGVKPFSLLFLTTSAIRLGVAVAGIGWFKEVRREVSSRSISQSFYQKVGGRALVEPKIYFFERRRTSKEAKTREMQ